MSCPAQSIMVGLLATLLGCSAVPPHRTSVPRTTFPLRLVAPRLSITVATAVVEALAGLHHAIPEIGIPDNPGEAVVNRSPPPGNDLVFLVAHGVDAQSSGVVPDDCMFLDRSTYPVVALCEPTQPDQCYPILEEARGPIVLCDERFVNQLWGLTRVLYEHASGIEGSMTNDQTFMELVDRLEQHPEELAVEDPADDVSPGQIGTFMSTVLLFILAHEYAHHAHPDAGEVVFSGPPRQAPEPTPSGEFVPDESTPTAAETAVLCRNNAAFERSGFAFESVTPTSLADETETGFARGALGESELVALRHSRAVWAAEQAADEYAMHVVAEHVEWNARHADDDDAGRFLSAFIRSMSFLGMYFWYERLADFVATTCSEETGQRYLLMHCMCHHGANHRRTMALFDENHPPMFLRMFDAANGVALLVPSGIRSSDGAASGRAWMRMLRVLLHAPATLAMDACWHGRRAEAPVADHAMQFYPAIETLHSSDGPPPEERAQLLVDCIERMGMDTP